MAPLHFQTLVEFRNKFFSLLCLAEGRQFGGFGRPNFGRPNFNQFNNNRGPPPPPQQQQQPPQQGGEPTGVANVFRLSADRFPLEDELSLPTDQLPGVASGNVVIPPLDTAAKTNRVNIDDQSGVVPADAKSCVSTKDDQTNNGFCSSVFDVVIKRRCANFRTLKSTDCQDREVCCFKPSTTDHTETPFDQVPCGLRRTPELAQRELQRIADEDNFDTVPMRILGGLEAFQTEICWQVRGSRSQVNARPKYNMKFHGQLPLMFLQAAVKIDGKYVCGGAVINSRFVLTAGHWCVDIKLTTCSID